MIVLGIPVRVRQVVYVAGDLLCLLLAAYLGHGLRLWLNGPDFPGLSQLLTNTTGASFFFMGIHLLFLYVFDTYSTEHDFRKLKESLRLWAATVPAFGLLMAISYAAPYWGWGRGIALLSFLFFGLFVTLWRWLVCELRPVPAVRRRSLILGTNKAGRHIAALIGAHREYSELHQVAGLVGDPLDRDDALVVPILGPNEALADLLSQHQITEIIVAEPHDLGPQLTKVLLDQKAHGIHIVDVPTLYKHLTGRVPISYLSDAWLIFGPGFHKRSPIASAATRLIDMSLSVFGLILSMPLMVPAIAMTKLTSRGPVFYSQERIGKNEVPYMVHKLRTMVVDAEASTGAVWSEGKGDPRVTPVGRLLRSSRLDEVPQLWNVLKGDMALVGPRPERGHFVEQLKEHIPFYGLRFAVKPGVTGWAQVSFRYGSSIQDSAEKLEYDLYSIQEMSPALYFLILLKTIQTILLRPGS